MDHKICSDCGRDVTCSTCHGYGVLHVDRIRTNGIRTEIEANVELADCPDCNRGWRDHDCPEYRTFITYRTDD